MFTGHIPAPRDAAPVVMRMTRQGCQFPEQGGWRGGVFWAPGWRNRTLDRGGAATLGEDKGTSASRWQSGRSRWNHLPLCGLSQCARLTQGLDQRDHPPPPPSNPPRGTVCSYLLLKP